MKNWSQGHSKKKTQAEDLRQESTWSVGGSEELKEEEHGFTVVEDDSEDTVWALLRTEAYIPN